MRLLCISTYELGQQPVSLAGLVALLRAGGHEVAVADLSIEPFPAEAVERAEAVVFSVPMHTATELALRTARRIVVEHGRRPFAFVGLYATVVEGDEIVGRHDLLAAGEAGEALTHWLDALEAGRAESRGAVSLSLGPAKLGPQLLPDRSVLAPLDSYARYLAGGESRLVAAVETTRGCNHTCRHCPVAPVYKGRSRMVPVESVLADLNQAVSLGATHVTFADPDFLNRPRHALEVAEAVAARPEVASFDATIKVEHILRHADLLERLVGLGLSFVTSAFESTDDEVLTLLDKGHCAAHEREAVALCRRLGLELRPSWLPFSPWTTLSSFASLLDFAARADLVSSTDPVQYSIRLLLPAGSLLCEAPDPVLQAALEPVAPRAGGTRGWRHADPRIDELQARIAGLVGEDSGDPEPVFRAIWQEAAAAGAPLASEPPAPEPGLASPLGYGERPRLSESWFCCAEPTLGQMEAVAG